MRGLLYVKGNRRKGKGRKKMKGEKGYSSSSGAGKYGFCSGGRF